MSASALVTGGAGFIGVHLATRLIERGVEVTLIDDFSRGRDDAYLGKLRRSARLIEHDLTSPLPRQLSGEHFSQVFHFAAVVGVRRVSAAPEEVLRVNLLSTLNLLEWCKHHPPDSFFLSSTSEIGDGARAWMEQPASPSEDGPVVFMEPLRPRSSYAVSKLTCELIVANYSTRHGFKGRIGRYHNVYGPRMGHEHVIPELMIRARERIDPFPVWSVEQSRAFCYIEDAVQATLIVMALEDPEPLVTNIGNDLEEITIGELADRILKLSGHRATVDPQPPPPGSPQRRRPNLERLRALTGWEPQVSLQEGLRRTWEWYGSEQDDSHGSEDQHVAAG